MLNLHEHEVGGRVEVGQADEGEVVVKAVQGCWHEVEAKNLFLSSSTKLTIMTLSYRQYSTGMTGDMVGIRSGERSTPSYS